MREIVIAIYHWKNKLLKTRMGKQYEPICSKEDFEELFDAEIFPDELCEYFVKNLRKKFDRVFTSSFISSDFCIWCVKAEDWLYSCEDCSYGQRWGECNPDDYFKSKLTIRGRYQRIAYELDKNAYRYYELTEEEKIALKLILEIA